MQEIRSFTYQILKGCSEMHAKHIVHRDLKLENVLLADNGVVKIADFGASKVIEPGSCQNTPYVVSRYYRAPELILATTEYGPEIDIWAVGCMIFHFVTGTPLFPGDSEGMQILEQAAALGFPDEDELTRMKSKIPANSFDFFKQLKSAYSGSLKGADMDKIFECYIPNQKDRSDCIELMLLCLKWVPQERITALQALSHPFLQP